MGSLNPPRTSAFPLPSLTPSLCGPKKPPLIKGNPIKPSILVWAMDGRLGFCSIVLDFRRLDEQQIRTGSLSSTDCSNSWSESASVIFSYSGGMLLRKKPLKSVQLVDDHVSDTLLYAFKIDH
ncbi:unnamed protein product [Musa banksii]